LFVHILLVSYPIMLKHIVIISRFTLIESRRNHLFFLSSLMLLTGFLLAEFIGDLTLTEHRQTQVALLAAFLRFGAVVLISLFVVSSTLRERQDKMLEMILALPVQRVSYYLGKLNGFIIIAALISLLFTLEILCYANVQQGIIWGLSLWLELVLVAAISLLMLFSFRQIPAALAGVFIIYSASRIMTVLYLMAVQPIIPHTAAAEKFMDGFIATLSWLLPDLSQYTRTRWLLDNSAHWTLLTPLIEQTGIYLLLLSMVALFDFYRKNF